MEQTKDNLINSLIVTLADDYNLPISELKQKLQMELYDWNVQKIETTELSVKNRTHHFDTSFNSIPIQQVFRYASFVFHSHHMYNSIQI